MNKAEGGTDMEANYAVDYQTDSALASVPARSRWRYLKLFIRNKKAVVGAVILSVIVLSSVFAPWITSYSPTQQNIRNRLQPPSRTHLLGTDNFGRDTFTRIIYGGRISLRVGFISIGIALSIGGLMGLIAGYYGGILDAIFMRLVDILLALPGFLLALAIVAALGSSLTNVMIAVGISYIPVFARVMRSAVLAIRKTEYIIAAQAAGASDMRIIFRHILPNAINPIIVQATLALAGAILSAAGLSFLGMGAQPPTPEWGSMISQSRQFIRESHYVVTFPGLAIFLTVLSLNLVGDGLRDMLDPRMKNIGIK